MAYIRSFMRKPRRIGRVRIGCERFVMVAAFITSTGQPTGLPRTAIVWFTFTPMAPRRTRTAVSTLTHAFLRLRRLPQPTIRLSSKKPFSIPLPFHPPFHSAG